MTPVLCTSGRSPISAISSTTIPATATAAIAGRAPRRAPAVITSANAAIRIRDTEWRSQPDSSVSAIGDLRRRPDGDLDDGREGRHNEADGARDSRVLGFHLQGAHGPESDREGQGLSAIV